MPHLLVLSLDWPEPQAGSAGQHLLQILENFAAHGWRVTFACAAEAGEHKANFAARGITEHRIEAGDAGFLTSQAADVVLFDRYRSEERFATELGRDCPQALRVLFTEGLQSLREARQHLLRRRLVEGLDPNDFRALFATPGPELYRQMAPGATAQRELAAIWRSDLTLLATEMEIDLLINGFGVPDYLLHHCPPAVEPLAAQRPFSERLGFVSLGNFGSAANLDALLWIKHNLWPMLRRRLPEARLRLYGARPSPKAMALHAPEEGFEVLGWTEDTQAVMGSARVCLAPLRFGAGITGQLLDALRCGTPSVTTPIGAEGIQGQRPWPGTVEGTAEGLAKAAAALYGDEAAWQQAQDACTPLLRLRFDRQRQGAALVGRVEHSLGQLEELRLFNFTGAMLRRSREG
jgi:hypothetical protein